MKNSFICAFRGVWASMKNERNMRIHMAVAFYVLLAAVVTHVTRVESICLMICIALVIGAELLNTAMENICDVIHPDYSNGVGKAKDIAAGAVLVCALISAAVGVIIFFNRERIGRAADFAQNNIVLSIIIVLSVPVAAFLVFRGKKKI